jgi:hypothetical protein
MAGMENVEAAVGEDDLRSFGLPVPNLPKHFVMGAQLVWHVGHS